VNERVFLSRLVRDGLGTEVDGLLLALCRSIGILSLVSFAIHLRFASNRHR